MMDSTEMMPVVAVMMRLIVMSDKVLVVVPRISINTSVVDGVVSVRYSHSYCSFSSSTADTGPGPGGCHHHSIDGVVVHMVRSNVMHMVMMLQYLCIMT